MWLTKSLVYKLNMIGPRVPHWTTPNGTSWPCCSSLTVSALPVKHDSTRTTPPLFPQPARLWEDTAAFHCNVRQLCHHSPWFYAPNTGDPIKTGPNFLCALERVLEMTTIQLRAFLGTAHEVVHDVPAHRPRNGSHLLSDGFLEVGNGPGPP